MAKENKKLYMTERQASERYPLSMKWFQQKRTHGAGPPYIKLGRRVMYNVELLELWIRSHGFRTNTSEKEEHLKTFEEHKKKMERSFFN